MNVEAGDLAFLKAEHVPDHLVLQPVRLILQWPAFEIADGLLDLPDNRPVRNLVEAHGLDMRTDDGPLACPVLANGLAAVYVAAVHSVGPSDVASQRRKAALFQGNRDALNGFTGEKATQLVALLIRLITNLDRAVSAEEPSHSA